MVYTIDMPGYNQVIKTFPKGGTIRIDDKSVLASVIKIQKRVSYAEIKSLGSIKITRIRKELYICFAYIDKLPQEWRILKEVGRVSLETSEGNHILSGKVEINFNSSDNLLTLYARGYN